MRVLEVGGNLDLAVERSAPMVSARFGGSTVMTTMTTRRPSTIQRDENRGHAAAEPSLDLEWWASTL